MKGTPMSVTFMYFIFIYANGGVGIIPVDTRGRGKPI